MHAAFHVHHLVFKNFPTSDWCHSWPTFCMPRQKQFESKEQYPVKVGKWIGYIEVTCQKQVQTGAKTTPPKTRNWSITEITHAQKPTQPSVCPFGPLGIFDPKAKGSKLCSSPDADWNSQISRFQLRLYVGTLLQEKISTHKEIVLCRISASTFILAKMQIQCHAFTC